MLGLGSGNGCALVWIRGVCKNVIPRRDEERNVVDRRDLFSCVDDYVSGKRLRCLNTFQESPRPIIEFHKHRRTEECRCP